MLNFLDLPYMAPHPVTSSFTFIGSSITLQRYISTSSIITVGTYTVTEGLVVFIETSGVQMIFSGNTVSLKATQETGFTYGTKYYRIIDAGGSLPSFATLSPSFPVNNNGIMNTGRLTLEPDTLTWRVTTGVLPPPPQIGYTLQLV